MGEARTSKLDDLKGRLKEAAGSLLDNEELKRSGRADRAAGKAKDKAGEVIDSARDKLSGEDEEPRSPS